jgi:hypothetical protein
VLIFFFFLTGPLPDSGRHLCRLAKIADGRDNETHTFRGDGPANTVVDTVTVNVQHAA